MPTSYGGSPLGLWELSGRAVHLLGGSPHEQMKLTRYLQVVSVDGNVAKKQATSRCLYWTAQKTATGHWQALDGFDGNGPLECVRRSSINIISAWRHLHDNSCHRPTC